MSRHLLTGPVRGLACGLVALALSTGALSADPDPAMQLAASTLQLADELDEQARGAITTANTLRKQVNELRARQRQQQAVDAVGVDALAEQVAQWQATGQQQREASAQLRRLALAALSDAFASLWQQWVTNPAPLVMDAVTYEVVARNSPVRTVHPNKLDLLPSTDQLPAKHAGMSIRVPALSGQQPPAELDVSSFQVGRQRLAFAHIEVEPDVDGAAQPVPLNRIHRWRLLLSDLVGRPLEGMRIEVVGHMPGHVHGLPTQPQVTDELAPGVYLVDGMKFQMNGWWVIEFHLVEEAGEQLEALRFNLLL